MQVHTEPNLSPEQVKEMEEKLGVPTGVAVPYDREVLEAAIEEDGVKKVEVFKLKPRMVVEINGTRYKVIAVRPNGKITMRPLKS
jgi:hypothetical protein